jgi:hypothetical protein
MATTRMTWSILDTEGKVSSLPKMPFRLQSLLQWILPLAAHCLAFGLNDSPSSISPLPSRSEARKLTRFIANHTVGLAAHITTKPFYAAGGPFERALETRLPYFGGGETRCDGVSMEPANAVHPRHGSPEMPRLLQARLGAFSTASM